jgi:hypothetical protein
MVVTPDNIVEGSGISAELFASLRRSDYIITILANRVWRVVSEDSRTRHLVRVFPADYPHRAHFHCQMLPGE